MKRVYVIFDRGTFFILGPPRRDNWEIDEVVDVPGRDRWLGQSGRPDCRAVVTAIDEDGCARATRIFEGSAAA